MEQAQLFETADERGCTPMFGAGHRRASAVPYPRRYEARSLDIVSDPHTPKSATDETDLRAVPAMTEFNIDAHSPRADPRTPEVEITDAGHRPPIDQDHMHELP